MEMQLASKRRALRRAVAFDCQVVRERDFVLLGDRGIDLSTDGMLLPSSAAAVLGQPVSADADHSRWVPPMQIACVVEGLCNDDSHAVTGTSVRVYGRA